MSLRPLDGGPLNDRSTRLFIALAAFFCVNAVLAEFIGVKIFALEDTLGIAALQWNLFGQTGSLNFTAGTLLWPIVFIMTDTVNEYYGRRGVRNWSTALSCCTSRSCSVRSTGRRRCSSLLARSTTSTKWSLRSRSSP